MSVRRLGIFVASCLAGLAACGGDGGVKDEDLAGLVIAPPDEEAPVDPAKAANDAAELARALAIKHHDVSKALGAHTVTIATEYSVSEGDKIVEGLIDESVLEVSADGQYHAKYDNNRDYGREVIFLDGNLYLRQRYERWHKRAPNDKKEAAQILDQMYAFAGDYFDLVAHGAEVSDKGAAQAAGRAGTKVEIKLAPTPGKAPVQKNVQRKWRENVVVTALAGEAVLDADTAVPLSVTFEATLGFSRDGRAFTMKLKVKQEISGVGAAIALATPPSDETVETPERLKEVDERDYLLEGMAPPAKKSGGSDEKLPGQP